MKNNSDLGLKETEAQTSQRDTPRVTVFGYYKGHCIEGSETGHPHTQNVSIDGKPAGYVVFPTPVIATGRSIIDARETLAADRLRCGVEDLATSRQ